MEASHNTRGLEDEQHGSSESGWTMYIGSSIHENDHYDFIGEYSYNTSKQVEGYNKNRCPKYDGNGHNDDESDDSMASDASSGPILHQLPSSSDQNLGMDYYKHEPFKSFSAEKLHKQVIKRDQRRNKFGKEKLELKALSAASHAQSRDKVKITNNLRLKE
ncbi:uncharacterized protein LOC111289047 [Durio zibethinus]|uniref:Uncharacterized protein LOC111289047 n=1 Tax=Durio zibethinus TaxID=66656 RepID=A0A6P5Y5E2_DURZI|nr:uncharacterized protein LOC111289047 [Durio zibethinus]